MERIEVDGYVFVQDPQTGYYSNRKLNTRLHRYIWEKHNGCKIPEGYDVHHKDHNKLNNDPSNLVLITRSEHHRQHAIEMRKEKSSEIICKCCGKNAIRSYGGEFCSDVCKSKWRRDQGLDDIELTCTICGKKFKRNKYFLKGQTEFACSRKCGSYLIARHKRQNKLSKGIVIEKDRRKPAPDWVILPRDSEGRV